MGQQQDQGHSRSGSEPSWLATLIETFEQVSHADIRATPCDASVLTAVREQLARPVDAGHNSPGRRLADGSDADSLAGWSMASAREPRSTLHSPTV